MGLHDMGTGLPLDCIAIRTQKFEPKPGESEADLLLRAVRAWAESEGIQGWDTLEVRHTRVNGHSKDLTHYQCESFVGHRTPAGGGQGEQWEGWNVWVHLYYAQGEAEPC